MPTDKKNKNEKTDTTDCLSASELVHRHLKDENHKISENDLQKVTLECNETRAATTNTDVEIPDSTSVSMNANDTKEENAEKDEKDVIITPLDVIS